MTAPEKLRQVSATIYFFSLFAGPIASFLVFQTTMIGSRYSTLTLIDVPLWTMCFFLPLVLFYHGQSSPLRKAEYFISVILRVLACIALLVYLILGNQYWMPAFYVPILGLFVLGKVFKERLNNWVR